MSNFGRGFIFDCFPSKSSISNKLLTGILPGTGLNESLESTRLCIPSGSVLESGSCFLDLFFCGGCCWAPNSFLTFTKVPFGGPECDSLDLASAALDFDDLDLAWPRLPVFEAPTVVLGLCLSVVLVLDPPGLADDPLAEWCVLNGASSLVPVILALSRLSPSTPIVSVFTPCCCTRQDCISFGCITLFRDSWHTAGTRPLAPATSPLVVVDATDGKSLDCGLLSTGVMGCFGMPMRCLCEEMSIKLVLTLLNVPSVSHTLLLMSSRCSTWR